MEGLPYNNYCKGQTGPQHGYGYLSQIDKLQIFQIDWEGNLICLGTSCCQTFSNPPEFVAKIMKKVNEDDLESYQINGITHNNTKYTFLKKGEFPDGKGIAWKRTIDGNPFHFVVVFTVGFAFVAIFAAQEQTAGLDIERLCILGKTLEDHFGRNL